jgi:hypothetical protein
MPETPITSTIADEDQFHDALIVAKEKQNNKKNIT